MAQQHIEAWLEEHRPARRANPKPTATNAIEFAQRHGLPSAAHVAEQEQRLVQEPAGGGVDEEMSAAREALQLAQINLTAAEQALERHERITPAPGEVSAWATRRAQLQGELEAYARLLEQATARATRARAQDLAARHHQWQQRMAEAQQALEAAYAQGNREHAEAQAALVRVQEQAQRRMAHAQAHLNQVRVSEPRQ